MRRKVFGETAPLKPLKIVFVFNELDKLDEYQLGVQGVRQIGSIVDDRG